MTVVVSRIVVVRGHEISVHLVVVFIFSIVV